jgi:hypothetical protein
MKIQKIIQRSENIIYSNQSKLRPLHAPRTVSAEVAQRYQRPEKLKISWKAFTIPDLSRQMSSKPSII